MAKSMNEVTDDILLDPDYELEDGFIDQDTIDEIDAVYDEAKRESMKKSQPGPTDVHVSTGMFNAAQKKKPKRKKIGKSFDEIYKARAKSGYGPGKNPNSHKKKALGGLAGTAKDRMKESEEAVRLIEGGFASSGRRREVGFAPKGHDSLSEWKNPSGKKHPAGLQPDQIADEKAYFAHRNATAKPDKKKMKSQARGARENSLLSRTSDRNTRQDAKVSLGRVRQYMQEARTMKQSGHAERSKTAVRIARKELKWARSIVSGGR